MKKEKRFYTSVCILVSFLLWTTALRFVDVQAIGPCESSVGFASVNRLVHNLTGVHMSLYTVTDWLGLVPIAFGLGFALLGFVQWIKRKKLTRVDGNLFVLGGFYIVVTAIYIFFEIFVVNYRPVLINGYLEASYPSSTTMLVMCVMPTSIMQFNSRIKNRITKSCINTIISAFTVFMVVARLISGVHWFTDIIGGILLSAGLVIMYSFVNKT
jgi:undecaprenyl-diphosphatase